MHTTETLILEHFRTSRSGGAPGTPGDLGDLFPKFSESDRLGVVCSQPLDGIRDAGYAVLAGVTAFYEMRRGELASNPTYPVFFAFQPRGSQGADAWGELDIWPASQWIETDGSPTGMLAEALDRGVTRLLWPEPFALDVQSLPAPTVATAGRQLRSVLIHGSGSPTTHLHVADPVEDLVHKAVERMPDIPAQVRKAVLASRAGRREATPPAWTESYRVLTPTEFLSPVR